jgi:hypothetical protein
MSLTKAKELIKACQASQKAYLPEKTLPLAHSKKQRKSLPLSRKGFDDAAS